jgi:hypothetical protein
MRSTNTVKLLAAASVIFVFVDVLPAFGQLAATATISSAPDGANFDYSILVKDTGTTNIGTFWFAWTPPGQPFEYDFLPSAPLATIQPTGWVAPTPSGIPGYSIEFYNVSGTAITPGQTGTFGFTSSATPAQLMGTSIGFPITTSFIYTGFPEVGAAAQVGPVFVPEPTSFLLAAMAGLSCAFAARQRWRSSHCHAG